MNFFWVIFFFSWSVIAQSTFQPLKETSDDLKSGFTMFSIEVLTDSKTYQLERSPNLDYFLKMKVKSKEGMVKVSAKEAKKLDMIFASKFLKCQYELPPSIQGCKVTLRLMLKGDEIDVCEKEDRKTQEIKPFLKELEEKF